MSDLALLVKGVLVDLDGAGALATYLSRHGRRGEAVALRRRLRDWRDWRRSCPNAALEQLSARDDSLRVFIAERFGTRRPEDVRLWGADEKKIAPERTRHVVRATNGAGASAVFACGRSALRAALTTEVPQKVCGACLVNLQLLDDIATTEGATA